MLTLRGTTLLATAVVLWAVGRLLGVAELFVLAAAAPALVVAAAVAVHSSTATTAARRSLSATRLLAGGSADVTLQLRNDARLPAPLLLVEDHCPADLAEQPARFVVPGLRAGRTVSLGYTLSGAGRGRYTVGPMTVRVRDPFGLVERRRRYSATDEVLVYPRVEALPSGLARGAHHGGSGSAERRLFNTGDEFHTMREYATGDDLRQVHWPSTAHRQKLMVRQQELPLQAQATVLVDTRASRHSGAGADSTFEKAVSVAASLVWHLADHRYELQLVTADQDRVPPLQPWSTHLDRLAELQPCEDRPLAALLARLRSGSEGLLAVVLGAPTGTAGAVADDPDVRALLQAGRTRSGRLCVIVDRSGAGADGAEGSSPARQLAAVLQAARWRAVVLTPGQALGEALRPTPRGAGPTASPSIPSPTAAGNGSSV